MTSLLYSGESFDSRIGQQYLRARWYNATVGRFSRLDPFSGLDESPLTYNKFVYGESNPVTHIDPSGHFGVAGLTASFGVANSLRKVHANSAFNVLAAVHQTAKGLQAGLSANQIFQSYLLEEILPTIGFGVSIGRIGMELIENYGVFIESSAGDPNAIALTGEQDAISWVEGGGAYGVASPDGSSFASGIASFARFGRPGTAAQAAQLVSSVGKIAGASRFLVQKSGKGKLHVMSYGAMNAFRQSKRIFGQAHHVLQDAIFSKLGIPRNNGLAINLKGHAGSVGTPHNLFHKHMDDWFDLIRAGKIKNVTVNKYNNQMVKALRKAGVSDQGAKQVLSIARKQQKFYKIGGTTPIPKNILPQRVTTP